MKTKTSGSGNPRGRGKYHPACDVCARKKIGCDGIQPVCQPCRQQGRELECTWTKKPARKPRTEQHFEAMHKHAESLRVRALEWRKYADYLESQLGQTAHRSGDFRVLRPSDTDGLLGPSPGILDQELGVASDDDGASDPGDPAKELCIPLQSLKLEENGFLHHGNPSPFRFEHVEPPPPSTQLSRFPALAQQPDATYVLLTDDAPDLHYNPDFDWSRHLPDVVPLDRRTHDKALDLIFKFFTSWCLRVVPALFLRDMYRSLSIPTSHPSPKTPHYSPMLHNALVALGLAFVDDQKLRDLKSRQYFANKAKSYIESECSKPNLSVVNALSILASFHSSKGDQTLGYLFFGMSGRMAQALGLSVDCSEWVKAGLMDESELLDRRWTHWTTFTQDACWSLYVGREFCVPTLTTDTAAFKAISKTLVDYDYDQLPWVHPPSKLKPQPNYLTKTFEATCELLTIARRVMDVVNRLDRSHSRPLAINELITEIDLNLNTWKGGLSPELDITHKSRQTATPHKLMMHLAYWWLFILLHRPFFQRKGRLIYSNDRQIDHVKLCRRAAENIMELLMTWRSLYTLRYCPITLIQTVFSAGTIYLLTGMQANTGLRVAQKELGHSIHQQELVLEYLNEIGKSWQCATNIAGIMKNLMDEQLKPLLERRTIPISSSGGALAQPARGSNVNDDDPGSSYSSSKRGHRRQPSLMKSQQHHMDINTHNHPTSDPSGSRPAVHHASSLSPNISVSHNEQNVSTYAVSSSGLSRSAPIPIPIQASDSFFTSNSPSSSLHPSFADSPLQRRSHLFNSGSASSVMPSAESLYGASTLSSSASTSFSLNDYNIGIYGDAMADPSPILDELAPSGSGHAASHLFQENSASFDILQELGTEPSYQPLSPANEYSGQDISEILGMLGGGMLSMAPSAPYVGLNFNSTIPLSPESTFTFESPQTSFSRTSFTNYSSSMTFADLAIRDTDMRDGAIWDIWAQTTER